MQPKTRSLLGQGAQALPPSLHLLDGHGPQKGGQRVQGCPLLKYILLLLQQGSAEIWEDADEEGEGLPGAEVDADRAGEHQAGAGREVPQDRGRGEGKYWGMGSGFFRL